MAKDNGEHFEINLASKPRRFEMVRHLGRPSDRVCSRALLAQLAAAVETEQHHQTQSCEHVTGGFGDHWHISSLLGR
jgi:hypothetical protein